MSKVSYRRWFRFSLKTLLIATLLIGAILGWVVKERKQSDHEAKVAKELMQAGCSVYFAGPYDTIEVYDGIVPQSWWRKCARGLFGQRIIRLAVSNSDLNTFLAPSELSNLQRLDVLKIDDANLATVSEFTTLHGLDVSMSSVQDLEPLARLKNLTVIWIFKTNVRDLGPLSQLTNLEVLGISDTAVDDLMPLEGLYNLQRLYIQRTNVTSKQLDALQKKLPNCIIIR